MNSSIRTLKFHDMLSNLTGHLLLTASVVSCIVGYCGAVFKQFQFVVQPFSTTATPGSPLRLDCSVTVDQPSSQPVVTWIKDGHPLVYDRRRYLLSNGSLYFQNIEHNDSRRTDEGRYHCIVAVKNLGTIMSNRANLRISVAKSVFSSMEPEALHLRPGDLAMLPCHGEGHSYSTVTWFQSERELTTGRSGIFVHPDGVLEIRSLQASDFGSYKCIAMENRSETEYTSLSWINQGSTKSMNQKVMPEFVMRPKDSLVVEGASVVLHCGANGRDRIGAQPSVVWLKNGVTVELIDGDFGQSRYSIAGTSSLKIDRIEEQDAGSYTCRAFNKEDVVDAEAALTVLVPSVIQVAPQNIIGQLRHDVEFHCGVRGIPKPTIQWVKDGEDVFLGDYLHVVDGTILRILGLVATDAGMYQCFASNDLRTVQSSAQLIVVSPPEAPKNVSGTPSTPVDLKAVYVSARGVMLTWKPPARKGQSDVVTFAVVWKERHSNRERVTNVTGLVATVHHLKSSTQYSFTVTAWNSLGSSEPASVTVEMPPEALVPDAPTDFCAVALSSTSILIKWKTPLHTHGPVITYKVFYFCSGVGDMAPVEADFNVLETEFTMNALQKYQVYVFRVVAYNINGPGTATDEVTCRTLSDVPSQSPQNVTGEAVSATMITVHWEEPPEEAQNGLITGYRIRYRPRLDKSAAGTAGETVTTDGARRMYDLSDLQKNTEYNIRVHAVTVNGSGPGSPPITVKTFLLDLDESKVPGKPRLLRVQPLTNAIRVSWNAPAESSVAIKGYILGYGVGIPDVYQQILDSRQQFHTIRGLRSGSEYVISLKAFNSIGEGQPAYETTQTEDSVVTETPEPLLPPFGVRATVLSSSSVVLSWSDSSISRGQKMSDSRVYTVRYSPKMSRKSKTFNTTELSCQLEDLKPDTDYEFSVKIVKGNHHSTWSLSVFNRTRNLAPSSAPRDLIIFAVDGRPNWVSLSWQPPRQSNGAITGYLILYSTDRSLADHEWVVEPAADDQLSIVLRDFKLETIYYMKMQARNANGYGPSSAMISFRTPDVNGRGGGIVENAEDIGLSRISLDSPESNDLPPFVVWIIAACVGGILAVTVIAVLAVFCCRRDGKYGEGDNRAREEENSRPSQAVSASGAESTKLGVEELKPPDLWEHDPQSQNSRHCNQNVSQNSSCLGESEQYTQSTVASDGSVPVSLEDVRYTVRPLANLSAAGHPRSFEPGGLAASFGQSHATDMDSSYQGTSIISHFPRTQFASTPRVNIGDISQPPSSLGLSSTVDYFLSTLERQRSHKILGSNPRLAINSDSLPPPPYQSSMPVHCDLQQLPAISSTGPSTLTLPRQILSRSLKRFPAASPAQSVPNTPNFRHIVRPMPSVLHSTADDSFSNVSASAAPGQQSLINPPSALKTSIINVSKSFSTEQLNAEVEHLEGLMKDLHAITKNELQF